MTLFKGVLIGLFAISAISHIYDAGKYSQGHIETRTGTKWAIFKVMDGAICGLFAIGLWLEW